MSERSSAIRRTLRDANRRAAHPADSAEALLRALIDHPHKCLCDDYNAIEKKARAALAAPQTRQPAEPNPTAVRRITAHLWGEDFVNLRAAVESFANGWTVVEKRAAAEPARYMVDGHGVATGGNLPLPAAEGSEPYRLPCGHDAAQQWWGRCRKCGAAAEGSEPLDVERLRWAFDRLGLTSYLPERAPNSRLALWTAIEREYADLAAYASQTSEPPRMVNLGEGATAEDIQRLREWWENSDSARKRHESGAK